MKYYLWYYALNNSRIAYWNLKWINLYIQQAKECLKQAIQYNKHDLSYIMLAKIYLMEGDVNMAIDVYKRAIE